MAQLQYFTSQFSGIPHFFVRLSPRRGFARHHRLVCEHVQWRGAAHIRFAEESGCDRMAGAPAPLFLSRCPRCTSLRAGGTPPPKLQPLVVFRVQRRARFLLSLEHDTRMPTAAHRGLTQSSHMQWIGKPCPVSITRFEVFIGIGLGSDSSFATWALTLSSARMHISVVTPRGHDVAAFELPLDCGVLDVKRRLAQCTGATPWTQKLLHGTRVLHIGRLREIDVPDGAVLTLHVTPSVLMVTASVDGTAKLWDVDRGACTQNFDVPGDGNYTRSAVFSGDGALLLTASGNSTAQLWNVTTGELLQVLRGHKNWLCSATFSPDDRAIVTASHDHTARVWSVMPGKASEVLQGHTGILKSACFSPDNTAVLTASVDCTAKLWAVQDGSCTHTLRGHESDLEVAVFSPDGTRVLTASSDHTARLWNTGSGTITVIFTGHDGSVNMAAMSPDGSRVVTASEDYTARLWCPATGVCMHILRGHVNCVNTARFSAQGMLLVTACDDGMAKIWHVVDGHCVKTLWGHDDEVCSAEFSADGAWVLTCSTDATAKIFSVETGTCWRTFRGHRAAVWAAMFAPIF